MKFLIIIFILMISFAILIANTSFFTVEAETQVPQDQEEKSSANLNKLSSQPTIIDIASIIIAIAALCVAAFTGYVVHRSTEISTITMYQGINKDIVEKYKYLGPLSPYVSIPNFDEEELYIRELYLQRFNRFKHSTWPWDRKPHIFFREFTMGNSLEEYYDLLIDRGATDEYARKAIKVLLEIKEREPYYNYNGKFWDTYFSGYDWRWNSYSKIKI